MTEAISRSGKQKYGQKTSEGIVIAYTDGEDQTERRIRFVSHPGTDLLYRIEEVKHNRTWRTVEQEVVQDLKVTTAEMNFQTPSQPSIER